MAFSIPGSYEPPPQRLRTPNGAQPAAPVAELSLKRRNRWPVVLMLVFVVMAVAGFTAVSFTPLGKALGLEKPTPKVPPLGPLYSFEPFIVNIAGTMGQRYLKATLTLELEDQATLREVSSREIVIRDAILSILSSKNLATLENVSMRGAIRQEIMETVNGLVARGRVVNVYFSEFVLQ